ncbi:MAG: type 1 glutamine amidotransferase domain-containing protein [Bacteroidota bacterium]
MKVLILVTNQNKYLKHNIPTGLWLSELTHMYEGCIKNNIQVIIASPKGGETPIDPESLKAFVLDSLTKKYCNDITFLELLKNTIPLAQVSEKDFDAIYLTGGHGTMYDFVGNETLNNLIKLFYENNKIVSAVCHGVCGLIGVKLSNGEYLIDGKNITGYSWFEEILARRKKQVPFNLEQVLKEKKANYKKGFVPLASFVITDRNLITGQNPFSSKKLAETVIEKLTK